ncbi:hypothetical protein L195_g054165 [Trifolium pratense]|uniref:Uncharacterized protein n=1 Tax=Trifolium pratense TaxID=57577 RepID=A0A2K3KEL3_TRIPR|nr:hypothetical protein L195_g054165 [Trifolium pratense]
MDMAEQELPFRPVSPKSRKKKDKQKEKSAGQPYNTRFGNPYTRIALKNFCFSHKQDINFSSLKHAAHRFKEWNLMAFGNVDHNVNFAIAEVTNIQTLIDENGITDDLQRRDFEAQLLLSKALVQQDSFWREKARVKKFSFGDCNTAYFHRRAQIRSATKSIALLRHEGGVIT